LGLEKITSLGFTDIYDSASKFLSNTASDLLLLDSYQISISDEFINPKNWLHILVIVDVPAPDYDCTLRIHPGLDSSWIGISKIPIMAGPKYIPFQSSLSKNMFSGNIGKHKLKITDVAGGSDPYGLVGEIAKIPVIFSEEFEVRLFSNSIPDSILDSRFRYCEVGHQLDELTKDFDLVLSTASTSSLEFLTRGLRVGIVCRIDNQEQYFNVLGKLEVAAQLGYRNLGNQWELNEKQISLLVTSSDFRSSFIAKAKSLIDFKGASRIVDALTNI
jgi:spore coat polysaccharide biosynthesis predicted glycosyltransferase SpsG